MDRTNILDKLGFSKPDFLWGVRDFTYNGYIIGTTNTIFGGIRFHLRIDNQSYLLEWCLGTRTDLIEQVFNVFIDAIDNSKVSCLPTMSNIKPFYKDLEFLEELKRLGYTLN